MLGFKPQKLDEIAPDLLPHRSGHDPGFDVGGVTAASLEEAFPDARSHRPDHANLPVAQVQGVTPSIPPTATSTIWRSAPTDGFARHDRWCEEERSWA
jgi:hypothetical protein